MLEKKYRLKSFSFKSSRQIKAKYFSLKFSQNGEEVSRFAFVVSKKVDPRATARNEMRRKVRAGIESLLDQVKEGYSFVFYPSKEALGVNSQEIQVELLEILKKEKLLK